MYKKLSLAKTEKNTAFYDCQNQILKLYSVDEYTGTYITIFMNLLKNIEILFMKYIFLYVYITLFNKMFGMKNILHIFLLFLHFRP